ncbi:Cleavage and polyadenylation specificity factor subunit 3, partial [Fragariocoptes setiger]
TTFAWTLESVGARDVAQLPLAQTNKMMPTNGVNAHPVNRRPLSFCVGVSLAGSEQHSQLTGEETTPSTCLESRCTVRLTATASNANTNTNTNTNNEAPTRTIKRSSKNCKRVSDYANKQANEQANKRTNEQASERAVERCLFIAPTRAMPSTKCSVVTISISDTGRVVTVAVVAVAEKRMQDQLKRECKAASQSILRNTQLSTASRSPGVLTGVKCFQQASTIGPTTIDLFDKQSNMNPFASFMRKWNTNNNLGLISLRSAVRTTENASKCTRKQTSAISKSANCQFDSLKEEMKEERKKGETKTTSIAWNDERAINEMHSSRGGSIGITIEIEIEITTTAIAMSMAKCGQPREIEKKTNPSFGQPIHDDNYNNDRYNSNSNSNSRSRSNLLATATFSAAAYALQQLQQIATTTAMTTTTTKDEMRQNETLHNNVSQQQQQQPQKSERSSQKQKQRQQHMARDNKRAHLYYHYKHRSPTPSMDSDLLIVRPLGAGQEVGRSCIYLEFKGKKLLLDCGIHPGLSGMEALPYMDSIDVAAIDLLLVSHFHLDHCGALPWFLTKTTFRGRCFMTHATKAIYRWLLADCIKISSSGTEQMLYTEHDLEHSMDKIEVVNFHEQREVAGVKFWCYNAGHVLGAAMFMIEIAGVKILYTGDFSRQEDRHLMSAEIPQIKPDVLITEATYGTHVHEAREKRETRFTGIVYDTVTRGGRCLIPVFALGRAQELLLILDEFWTNHPELHDIPIYYASSLAKKCMSVYQTYVNAMNERIKRQISKNNPFVFKHISNLKSIDHFDDVGPCVVMATPGMMQSGLSRELFETWCSDSRNTCIIAGYCVEGTLAKHILSEPDEITAMDGHKIPRKCQVEYISFSAHTDYKQTSQFVRELHPPHVILVHGEATEMARLKVGLTRQHEDSEHPIVVHNPRNTHSVELHFRGEKIAKVIGSLAEQKLPEAQSHLAGVLVKRNFNLHLMSPSDVAKYTDMKVSSISQRLAVAFAHNFDNLKRILAEHKPDHVDEDKQSLKIRNVLITLNEKDKVAYLDWAAGSVDDAYADLVVALLTKYSLQPAEEVDG